MLKQNRLTSGEVLSNDRRAVASGHLGLRDKSGECGWSGVQAIGGRVGGELDERLFQIDRVGEGERRVTKVGSNF